MSTQIKEHPIIFSSEMIRAIMNGSKTQSRRVIKPQPQWIDGAWFWRHPKYDNGMGVHYFHTTQISESILEAMLPGCPYQVGDRLGVRETCWFDQSGGLWGYKADGIDCPPTNCGGKPIPSIHMPRWASRITLEIIGVRVERLQDISGQDAVAEGIWTSLSGGDLPVLKFKELWDSKKRLGWDINPWVWVLEFRKHFVYPDVRERGQLVLEEIIGQA